MFRGILTLLIVFCFLFSLSLAESIYPVWQGATVNNSVAITFDDGPKPEYALPILNILDQYDIKATFFVVGSASRLHSDIIMRMAQSGHDVGNHTYTHTRLDTMEPDKINQELLTTNKILESVIGRPVRYFRPPGGRYNRLVLEKASENGLRTINWSVNAGDYTPYNYLPVAKNDNKWKKIVKHVVRSAKNGDILLFHNGGSDTQKALPHVIQGLREKGFKFVTVSELLYGQKPFFRSANSLK